MRRSVTHQNSTVGSGAGVLDSVLFFPQPSRASPTASLLWDLPSPCFEFNLLSVIRPNCISLFARPFPSPPRHS